MAASSSKPTSGRKPARDPKRRSKQGRVARAATAPLLALESQAAWFVDFLKQELAPYPGRGTTVARMVTAATITMLIIMTGHIPGGALGGYYALLFTRESLRATAQQVIITLVTVVVSTSYALLGIALLVDSPVTHFFWVIVSLYIIFFAMSTVRNYGVAAAFSFLIALAIPTWDRTGSVDPKIYLTLYTSLSVIIGALSALVVEAVYHAFNKHDAVLTGLTDRLQTIEDVLRSVAKRQPLAEKTRARLTQYAMIGPSNLRRLVIRAGQSGQMRAQVTALVSIIARLVDLAAHLVHETERYPNYLDSDAAGGPSEGEASAHGDAAANTERLRSIAAAIEQIRKSLATVDELKQTARLRTPAWKAHEENTATVPLVAILEQTTELLSGIFNSHRFDEPVDPLLPALLDEPEEPSFFYPDAFSNPEHLVFALRGCLAASACYLVYNALDWPGINTCIATCIITALGTIGSSRQKQALRITGAIAGGFLISLPGQIFLLPHMDSITAFTLYFVVVSAIAAWFATTSARLSYFGLQIAFAFYIINLQEFTVQTSLTVARDRVVGELLGLISMWLLFDQLWAPLATVKMQSLLGDTLELLAKSATYVAESHRLAGGGRREEVDTEANRAIVRGFRTVREKINESFSQMNAQADAIQFELGAGRLRQLAAREQMQAMQPAMRSIFLIEIAMLQARYSPRGYSPGIGPEAYADVDPPLQRFLYTCGEAMRAVAAEVKAAAAKTQVERRMRNSSLKSGEAHAAVDRSLAELKVTEADRAVTLNLCQQLAESVHSLQVSENEALDTPVADNSGRTIRQALIRSKATAKSA